MFGQINRLRRRRNDTEYPSLTTPGVTTDEATASATQSTPALDPRREETPAEQGFLSVDLAGRLSNPPPVVDTLADQGFQAKARVTRRGRRGANPAVDGASVAEREGTGRLSNPVQRRLGETEVDELVARYEAGSAIDELARLFEVNRTTVISHLDRRDVPRRRVVRKMTDATVAEAARRYDQGLSLVVVAEEFGVHSRTLAREFRLAGVDVRSRRGWPPRARTRSRR